MIKGRIIALLLILVLSAGISACGNETEIAVIHFSDLMDANYNPTQKMISLDKEQVKLNCFMASQSPLDGSFVYAVNLPYISCPYCAIDQGSVIINAIPIMAGKLGKIEFTDRPVTVTGRLEIASKTDVFGYTSPYRIFADKIEEADFSKLSDNMKDYMMLANDGVMNEIYTYLGTVSSAYYAFYYNENLELIAEVDLEAFRKTLESLKSYGIESYKPLIMIMEEYYTITERYNGIVLSKKYDDLKTIESDVGQLFDRFDAWNYEMSILE
jgi:hypothetical protein